MTPKPESRLEKLAFFLNRRDLGRFDAPVSREAIEVAILTMTNAHFRGDLIPDAEMFTHCVGYYSRAKAILAKYSDISDAELNKLLNAYNFSE